jgi:hypothetical protein
MVKKTPSGKGSKETKKKKIGELMINTGVKRYENETQS